MSNEFIFYLDGKESAPRRGNHLTVRSATAFRSLVSASISGFPHDECFVCVGRTSKPGNSPSCSAAPPRAADRKWRRPEVLDMRRTAFELLLSEHAGDCEAPCTIACPAHAAVEEYVRAGRDGDWLKCLQIVKERIPLPMSIGRVCPRFCEKDCRKNIFGAAVAINDFKRLAPTCITPSYLERWRRKPAKSRHRRRRTAGLSARTFCVGRSRGHGFDQMAEAGGMLRYGIPNYRLPKLRCWMWRFCAFREWRYI